jgi:multidrug efflux pump subunit AcrA (membrane-fusion protein)
MWSEGAADGTEVGITIAVTLSAVCMTAVPFAMRNADGLLFWLMCLVTGLGLATFNYSMAVDLVGQWRDALATPAATKQLTAAALDRRITDATAAKARLPQLPHITAAMVAAAKMALELGTQAKTQECATVGDNCRTRVMELTKAMTDLRAAESNRGNTLRLERLDGEIQAAAKEKLALGPIPSDTDPGAARIGKLLAKFLDMGPKPDLVVIEWWPTGIAISSSGLASCCPGSFLPASGWSSGGQVHCVCDGTRWRMGGGHTLPPPRRCSIARTSQAVRRRDLGRYASAAPPAEAPPLNGRADDANRNRALTDPRLLGWMHVEQGPPNSDHLLNVDPEEVDAIEISDAKLAEIVGVATEDRHHPEIVSPAGLYAIRTLAASLRQQKEELSPEDALARVLKSIGSLIGKRRRRLNSLAVVGKRIIGSTYDGCSLTLKYLAELRAADGAKILAPRLFSTGKRSLTRLINEFGTDATIAAIKAVLTRAMIDGGEPGSVTTWSYFRPALLEQRMADEMAAAGLRPGDVFGAHRAFQLSRSDE